eukprot:15347443-Ditylum_brightwellii.AAC.1
MDWYRQIKPANLVANGENYNKPIDISQPIDAYFAQIDDCIQYALDGKIPYTSKQILTTVLHTMQKTGWSKDGIRAWKARDPLDQTWQIFKKDLQKNMMK